MRRFQRRLLGVLEHDRHLADGDDVVVFEFLLRDLVAVDERAVGRVQVDDRVLRALLVDFGVLAGCLGVLDGDVIRIEPAENGGVLDFVFLSRSRAFDDANLNHGAKA